ncbi:MAG: peptide chain release factor 3 [Bdellovibrionota bacterium]
MAEIATLNQKTINDEIARRKTFAIISHPDAGKTTLTEKLLFYGGVVREAGSVKAKAGKKHATSDWMEMERKRGISITTTAIQFEHKGFCINLLDTPGHKDFSEDTYRTLMAVDAAVMLIDAAKGVEEQTKKLFQVCRKAGIPIFTFVNKLDREAKNPLQIIDEIENVLKMDCTAVNWPIGSGQSFRGVYDVLDKQFHAFDIAVLERGEKPKSQTYESVEDLKTHPDFQTSFVQQALDNFINEIDLINTAGHSFDKDRIMKGDLSPVFFGSAMNNFGMELFLDYFIDLAPSPVPRATTKGTTHSQAEKFSGVIFKIQANMDVNHRDSLAFLRICSGAYEKGLKVNLPRTGKEYKVNNAFSILGRDRTPIDNAFAGDIIGIVDTSNSLRIGDTLAVQKDIEYVVWTRFLPEVFADLRLMDPEKRKQLNKGLEQLSGEGIIQCLTTSTQSSVLPTLGAIGDLQFEVLSSRLLSEYGVNVKVTKLPWVTSRLLVTDTDEYKNSTSSDWTFINDADGNTVMLFSTEWSVRTFEAINKGVVLASDYESFNKLKKELKN